MTMLEGHDEIQAIFFEECAEGLAVAEEGLTAMADGDLSKDTIAAVFRAVHSIKGGSGAFGHDRLLAFSHVFENVLDEIRADRMPAGPDVIKQLLSALDTLSDHVSAAQSGGEAPADGPALQALEGLLRAGATGAAPEPVASAPAAAPAADPAADPADPFGFVPVTASIEAFDDPFGFEPVAVDLEDLQAADTPAGTDLPWTVHFRPSRAAMANGGEPTLVIRELERLGGTISDLDWSDLPELRDIDPENTYLAWRLSVPGSVAHADIVECFDFVAPDSIIEISRDTPPQPVAADAGPAADENGADVLRLAVAATAEPAAKADTKQADAPAQTIRIDLNKLDMLLNLVGELVIRGSILADRLTPAEQERVDLGELSRLTREIQDNVMSLRAQPIRQVFSRVPRLLRDLSTATGKLVRLETVGETTEVDKAVIEKLGDPLTHMIRNAVDHGLETPDERRAAGKPAEGVVRLSAEQKGGRIIVRVGDDGRGINRAKVREKAIERGIISAEAQLTNEEIDGLICAPGFSTAETISNISGRGVGMDVVRSNVEAMGGRVEIASVPGQGTTFTMSLPLTLAILDGMIVRWADQRFVLPLANVVEAVQPEPGQVHYMTPESEVIDLRGSFLPIKRLGDLFGLPKSSRAPTGKSPVIIVDSEAAGHVGVMVDTIDDRREVVTKSLDANLYPIRGLGGATILGDGSIALILDIDALISGAQGSAARFAGKGLAA